MASVVTMAVLNAVVGDRPEEICAKPDRMNGVTGDTQLGHAIKD